MTSKAFVRHLRSRTHIPDASKLTRPHYEALKNSKRNLKHKDRHETAIHTLWKFVQNEFTYLLIARR